MATQTFAQGDTKLAILRKLVLNQNGTYTPLFGDNEFNLVKKLVLNQHGAQSPAANDNERALWKKYLINAGGSPAYSDNVWDLLAKITNVSGGSANQYDNSFYLLKKILGASGGSTPVVPTGDITSNLELWWKFDEASGTAISDSGSGNTPGALFNDFSSNATFQTGQKVGTHCLGGFGGARTNWGKYAITRSLLGPITIGTWVKHTGNSNLAGAIATFYDSANAIGLGFRMGDGVDAHSINVINSTTPTGVVAASATTIGTWYHVAATYNNGVLVQAYLNGLPVNTVGSVGTVPAGSVGVWIGNAASEANQYSGALDDLRLYRRILNQLDITTLVAYT